MYVNIKGRGQAQRKYQGGELIYGHILCSLC